MLRLSTDPLSLIVIMKQKFFFICLLFIFLSCCKSNENNQEPFYFQTGSELFRVRATQGERLFGYWDRFDHIVIRFKYNEARQFSEGLAAVSKKGKWGFINPKDSIVIPLQYDWASSFGEMGFNGLALVKVGNDMNRIWYHSGGKTGLIDPEGKEVCPMKYIEIYFASNGLARVNDGTEIIPEGNGQWSYNGKYGFINSEGEEIISCQYDYANPFYSGLAIVTVKKKSGIIDCKGKIVIPFEYDSIKGPGLQSKEESYRLFKHGQEFLFDGKNITRI
ncbi:WG containing repeat-containing protein [Mariniphaga anaerophila]|uniref:WG containing repeat-containing protein n=2 Tax=Mariniphaga anaerophila TaxID=1484053 RepID=A0A1M5BVY2_9BACT|nr:WG containing repeat-containing protein [Mariniphaga anaerophila]